MEMILARRICYFALYAFTLSMILTGCSTNPFEHDTSPPLPQQARLVKGSEASDSDYYQWLSPHEIFTIAPLQAQRMSNGTWIASGNDLPLLVDTATGRKTILKSIIRLLGPGSSEVFNHTSQWKASPDGKWLLFRTHNVVNPQWICLSTETQHMIRWTTENPISQDSIAWMPDSRHWIEVNKNDVNSYAILTYSLTTPKVKVQPITWSSDLNKIYYYDPGILVLGFSSPNHLITLGEANDGPPMLFDIQVGPKVIGHTLRTHPTNFLMDVTLSPDGQHLAWRSDEQALWISNLDGSGKHVLVPRIEGTSTIRWTPDNKHVSFFYNNSLYLMPTD